MTSFAF